MTVQMYELETHSLCRWIECSVLHVDAPGKDECIACMWMKILLSSIVTKADFLILLVRASGHPLLFWNDLIVMKDTKQQIKACHKAFKIKSNSFGTIKLALLCTAKSHTTIHDTGLSMWSVTGHVNIYLQLMQPKLNGKGHGYVCGMISTFYVYRCN